MIEEALAKLALEDELGEPVRENLHLDHDRKGVPGSPDLAQAILEKIRNSAVFIADVTPIGKTDNGKSLINSNVAIELGYALSFVGDAGLLMVLNEAYGDRESLPFDLRHKASPITYKLPDNSTKEQITRKNWDSDHYLILKLQFLNSYFITSVPSLYSSNLYLLHSFLRLHNIVTINNANYLIHIVIHALWSCLILFVLKHSSPE